MPPIGDSVFPAQLDTLDGLIRAANSSSTTLSAALGAADTTATVGDTSSFPASGTLVIDDEILYYTSKTSTTFTGLLRAQEGTTASAHALGVEAAGLITAAHHNVLADAVVALQTQVGAGATTIPAALAALDARLDAIESGAGSNAFSVSDFGASGSAATSTGTVNLGSPKALTLAAGHDFAAGQGIAIAGAGAAGARLLSRIDSIAGNVATLRDSASTAVTSAAVSHDDTEAINAALDAAFDAKCACIDFPEGRYLVNGVFDATTNSLLRVKKNPTHTPFSILLRGPAPCPFYGYDAAPSQAGAIIETTLTGTGTDPAIFSAGAWDGSLDFANLNYISLYFQNLVFRAPAAPTISGVDLGMAFNAAFVSSQVDVNVGLASTPLPPASPFALRLPHNGNFDLAYIENSVVYGYGRGVIASEHFISNNASIMRCKTGLELIEGYHPAIGNMVIFQCQESIKFSGSIPVDFTVDFEIASPGADWWRALAGHDIYDPSNFARGVIRYKAVQTDTALPLVALTTGCATLALHDLHTGSVRLLSASVAGNLEVVGTLLLKRGGLALPVTLGDVDSAGAGFCLLRVPNTLEPVAPDTLAGIKTWLDATQITGLTEGQAVASWADRSSAANPAAQAVALKRPTFHLEGGFPLVRITVPQFLQFATDFNFQTFTYLTFMRLSAEGTIIGHNAGGVTFSLGSGKLNLVKTDVALVGSSISAPAPGVWARVAVTYASPAAAFYINGEPNGSATAAETFTILNSLLGAQDITNNGVGGIGADLRSVAVWNRALSPSEILQVDAYLVGQFV